MTIIARLMTSASCFRNLSFSCGFDSFFLGQQVLQNSTEKMFINQFGQ